MSLHVISGLLVAHGCASTQVRAPESSPLCTILINTLSMISYSHGAYIVETVTPTLTYVIDGMRTLFEFLTFFFRGARLNF